MRPLFVMLLILIFSASFSQDTARDANAKKKDPEEKSNILGALLSYNFSGNKKGLSNFTPKVDYGWRREFATKKNWVKYELGINPYAAGQIDVDEPSTFLPGLMLPGNAGIDIQNFFRFSTSTHSEFALGFHAGFKLISNFADSNTVLAQHNLRTSLSFSFEELFIIGVQYTHGWHNATSESEKLFRKVFGKDATDLGYITATLQAQVNNADAKSPTYLYVEWRSVANKDSYQGYDNSKIITMGFRKDMSLGKSAPAKRIL
jgi:hypothetical protein